jgi:DNA-binding transcriptional LysR family regulator
MELNNLIAIKGHVRSGMGICLISRCAVEHDLEEGRLIELPGPALTRQLSLLHKGTDRLPPATRALRLLLLASSC